VDGLVVSLSLSFAASLFESYTRDGFPELGGG